MINKDTVDIMSQFLQFRIQMHTYDENNDNQANLQGLLDKLGPQALTAFEAGIAYSGCLYANIASLAILLNKLTFLNIILAKRPELLYLQDTKQQKELGGAEINIYAPITSHISPLDAAVIRRSPMFVQTILSNPVMQQSHAKLVITHSLSLAKALFADTKKTEELEVISILEQAER